MGNLTNRETDDPTTDSRHNDKEKFTRYKPCKSLPARYRQAKVVPKSKTNPKSRRVKRQQSDCIDSNNENKSKKNGTGSLSDTKLVTASTGTSGGWLNFRCDADLSDEDDESYVYMEATEGLLNSQSTDKAKGDQMIGKAKPKSNHYPFRRSLFAHVAPYILFHSHDCTCSGLPKVVAKKMKWKLSIWTAPIVRKTLEASGFRFVTNDDDPWCGAWDHMFSKNYKDMQFFQKINHFPGTDKLGHKDQLWVNISQMMKKYGRKNFTISPQTYILPQDKRKLNAVWNDHSKNKWIIKPPNSGCGVGVRVVHQWWEVPQSCYVIIQRYLSSPKLIDGAKFDLRLYVLVTSFNPLKVYLYSDGLVRIATMKYSGDVKHHRNRFMHLTNTSVNKYSKTYQQSPSVNSAIGHLWSLKSLWGYLEKEAVNIPNLWDAMKDIVMKTIISAEPTVNPVLQKTLSSRYSCFELFGFDILIEENYKPWLLEVNTTPSLHTDSPLHTAIKGPLVRTLFNIAGYQIHPQLPQSTVLCLAHKYHLNPVCQDFRLHGMSLTHYATRKQFNYTYMNNRKDYLRTILQDLTPDDVRNLIMYEDELTQLELFEKIFPTKETHKYLKYFQGPRYYNMLYDAWEEMYGHDRIPGIFRLQELCHMKYHLMP